MPQNTREQTHRQPIERQADETLNTKEALIALWQTLPVEHQATLVMTLLDDVMVGEYGVWLQCALASKYPLQPEYLENSYPNFAISEQDLRRANLDEEEIVGLTAAQREQIAHLLRTHYIHDLFWPELGYIARLLLEEKGSGGEGKGLTASE